MRWLRRNLIIAALGLLTITGALNAAESLQLLLADTTVNRVEQGEAFLLWDGAGDFYAAEPELRKWRVRQPFPEPVWFDGQSYYRIRDLAGATAELDTRAMAIMITLPPLLLQRQHLRIRGQAVPEPSATPGMFLDYDLAYMDDSYDRYPFALVAPTVFSNLGVLQSEFMYRGISGPADEFERLDPLVRLDTTFTRDDPEKMRAYRAGDVFSATGPWGASLRLGGLQIASNFSTRPSFVTFPAPYLEGISSTASTVDLFIDGVLRYRENVDSGFFRIDDVPTVTGAGEMTMVVTDVTGRQQTITQGFYASSELLKPGLAEYSYSLGLLRENYTLTSNDYGQTAFIGAHRQGIDERWTLGGRLEVSQDVQLIGSTSDWALHRGGVVSAGLAVSNSDRDVGGAWLLGYEWQSDDYRVRAQATGSSRKMATVDPYLNTVPKKLQLVVTAGMNRGIVGSVVGTYAHQSYWDRDTRDVLTVTYSARVRGFFMSVYTSLIQSGSFDYMMGMTLTRSFGERGGSSTTVSHREGDTRMRVETQQRVPYGPGVGYRVGATLANSNQVDGTLIAQSQYGRYTLDARKFGGGSSWRAGTQGSLAWLGGRAYAAREIADGFAVARVANIPNVRVYLDNHEIGRSDAKGRVLLPFLRPYESNRVRIASEDLPLGVQVDRLELQVAPYFRSGMVVEFPVRTSRQLVLNAILESGDAVPEGAVVRIDGRDNWSIVGLSGMIYLTDLEATTHVTVTWLDQSCALDVPLPDNDEPLPNIGVLVCEEVEQ